MQQLKIYAIYDIKGECYGNLFSCSTDGIASRIVEQIALYSGNPDYSRYSEDFALYHLADWLDGNGTIVPCDHPRLVCTLRSVLQQCQERGAAVGGATPLKSQSVPTVEDVSDTTVKEMSVDDGASSTI